MQSMMRFALQFRPLRDKDRSLRTAKARSARTVDYDATVRHVELAAKKSADPLQYLPREIVLRVLANLSHDELESIATISQVWRDIALDGSLWTDVRVSLSSPRETPTTALVSRLHTLCHRSLSFLATLSISGPIPPSVTNDAMQILSDAMLTHCRNIVSLRIRNLRHPSITPSSLCSLLSGLTRLRDLQILGVEAFDDNVVNVIPTTSLKRLNISRAWSVTPEAISNLLESSEGLTHLTLSAGLAVDSSTIESISSVNLTSIEISHAPLFTDASLDHLARQRNLRSLILAECATLSDNGLTTIVASCPILGSLCIAGCFRITDAGFTAVSDLRRLERLDIESCARITGPGLVAGLQGCRLILRVLIMGSCLSIGDEHLAMVMKMCKRLRHLEADNLPMLTDAFVGGSLVSDSVALRRVELFDCRAVSRSALEKLEAPLMVTDPDDDSGGVLLDADEGDGIIGGVLDGIVEAVNAGLVVDVKKKVLRGAVSVGSFHGALKDARRDAARAREEEARRLIESRRRRRGGKFEWDGRLQQLGKCVIL